MSATTGSVMSQYLIAQVSSLMHSAFLGLRPQRMLAGTMDRIEQYQLLNTSAYISGVLSLYFRRDVPRGGYLVGHNEGGGETEVEEIAG